MRLFRLIAICTALFGSERTYAEINDTYFPVIFNTDDLSTVFIVGEVSSRLPLNLERALEELPDVQAVVLDSPGGDVHAALAAARTIRKHQLTTAIPGDASCSSACSFLFFAGVERYAFGQLGVHQISSKQESNFGSQIGVSDVIDVLDGFSVDPEVYVIMFRTPPDTMHFFSDDEKQKYNFLGRATLVIDQSQKTGVPLPKMTHVVSGLDPNGDGFLALRTHPSTSEGARITEMTQGTRLQVLDKQGVWFNVLAETGQKGWAHSNWISPISNARTSDGQSCDELWFERNAIFAKHGYCFQSKRGKVAFSNTGCIAGLSASDLPLSPAERNYVSRIVELEKLNKCR